MVGGVVGGPAGKEVLTMQLTLLPVVEDLLSEELGAAAVEEVVEDAEEEEGALEEEGDVGPGDGREIFRMLTGIVGWWHPPYSCCPRRDTNCPRSSSGVWHCDGDLRAAPMSEGVRENEGISHLHSLGGKGNRHRRARGETRHRQNLREDSYSY